MAARILKKSDRSNQLDIEPDAQETMLLICPASADVYLSTTEGGGKCVRYKFFFKLLIIVFSLSFVLYEVDLYQMAETISSIQIGSHIDSLLFMLLYCLIHTINFRTLLRPSATHQNVITFFRFSLLCRFYSFF